LMTRSLGDVMAPSIAEPEEAVAAMRNRRVLRFPPGYRSETLYCVAFRVMAVNFTYGIIGKA
jgi:hypothetical protein